VLAASYLVAHSGRALLNSLLSLLVTLLRRVLPSLLGGVFNLLPDALVLRLCESRHGSSAQETQHHDHLATLHFLHFLVLLC
jgi:hypothetical protein